MPTDPAPDRGTAERRLLRFVSLVVVLLFVFGLLSPVIAALESRLERLRAPVYVPASVNASPYGACADVCGRDGACRHVVVPEGWHAGKRVSAKTLAEAAACN